MSSGIVVGIDVPRTSAEGVIAAFCRPELLSSWWGGELTVERWDGDEDEFLVTVRPLSRPDGVRVEVEHGPYVDIEGEIPRQL